MPVLIRHLLRTRLRGWRLLGAAVLVLLQPVVQVLVSLTSSPSGSPEDDLLVAVAGTGVFVAIAMVMLAASTLRDERDDQTLAYLVLKPLPKWQIATATAIAAVGACLVVGLIATVGATLAGLVTGAGAIGLSTIAVMVPAAVGYGAVAAAAGYLAPRGLLLMLGYVFIWETIAGTLVPLAANSSLWRISLSVWAGVTRLPEVVIDEIMFPVAAGAGGGMLKIVGVVVVSIALLWWALRHRDLV